MDFPTLYGKPSTGDKIKQWTIKVVKSDNGAIIERSHGYVNHKITTSRKEISSGKNVGKKNETTALQQAIKDSHSLWTKQKQSGYSESADAQPTSVLPMLAHDYNKRHKDISSHFAIQPKIDGVRLIAFKDPSTNDVVFLSRTGKVMKNLGHIAKDLLSNNIFSDDDLYIDGELFTFDLPFEEISGLFRTSKACPDKVRLLKFYVFDTFFTNNKSNTTFIERHTSMKNTIAKCKYVKEVPTLIFDKPSTNTDQIVKDYHSKFVQQGYEGVMVRNCASLYKCGYRSKDLQKYKEFIDAEFIITGGAEATGEDSGTVIFDCKTSNCKTFAVRPRGSRELRKYMWENLDTFIGRQLTVRYQNMSELGIPRFPVGISIRDYE